MIWPSAYGGRFFAFKRVKLKEDNSRWEGENVMKISVIGGGAIGLLFAHFLKQEAHVTIWTKSANQAKKLLENGLHYESIDADKRVVEVNAKSIQDFNYDADYIIIAVKQTQLSGLKPLLFDSRAKRAKLLFVQNGMGHLELLQHLENEQISVAVVEHGAIRTSEYEIVHTGIGRVKLASFRGPIDAGLWEQISNERFPVIIYKDYRPILKEKLVANSVINPLTAIFQIRNGELIDNPHYQSLMVGLFHETCRILKIERKDELLENIMAICKNTSNNKSSMRMDIENGKETEIDAINGYVLKLAQKQGIEVPYTSFVYEAIKGMEHQRKA